MNRYGMYNIKNTKYNLFACVKTWKCPYYKKLQTLKLSIYIKQSDQMSYFDRDSYKSICPSVRYIICPVLQNFE